MSFRPLEAATSLERAYRTYVASTLRFGNPSIQRQFESQILQEGVLAKGPILEATPPYTKGATLGQLVEEGVLCEGMLRLGAALPSERALYSHQESAIRNSCAGQNQVIVTGTGSGKTECFFVPILDHLLREQAAGKLGGGVRALVLYPMNALANDQLKRLRGLLANVPEITFGRYTGETKTTEREGLTQWGKQHPGEPPCPGEILSREEARRNPPHILLTNYAMLEYLLLRPSDAPIFEGLFGSTWSHLVVDEAHVYSGTLGTEIAYLLRRLKARLGVEPGHLRCFATSATIGTTREDHEQTARFASDLFGEPFSDGTGGKAIDVVTSMPNSPKAEFRSPWGRLDLRAWHLISDLVSAEEAQADALAGSLTGLLPPDDELALASSGPDWPQALGNTLLGELTTQELLTRLFEAPLDVSDRASFEWSEAPMKPRDISAVVQVLAACARAEGAQLLSARYHSFLRAPEGAFLSLVGDPHLFLTRRTALETDIGKVPVYEVSTCRHCGQEYILGHRPRPTRDEHGNVVEVLEPEPPQESDDAEVPEQYYMLLLDQTTGENAIDEDQAEALATVHVEDTMWLCPVCATLHQSPQSTTGHLFQHEAVPFVALRETKARGDSRPCVRCGYQSANAIQRVRVSPESAGSVIVYDLVRTLPPMEPLGDSVGDLGDWSDSSNETAPRDENDAGSLICFSDRRQDAAFFAPALERTYGAVTRRQILYRAACAFRGEPFTPSDWQREIAKLVIEYQVIKPRPSLVETRKIAWAWVLTELMSEDGRASLEGLGLISYRIRDLDQLTIRPLLQSPWNLDELAARSLLGRLIDTLRDGRAIQWQEGLCRTDGLMPEHWSPVKFVKQRSGKAVSEKSWLPSVPHAYNSRMDYAIKTLESLGHARSDAKDIAIRLAADVWRAHLLRPDGRLAEFLVAEGNEATGLLQALPDLWEIEVDPIRGFARCDHCGRLVVGSALPTCPTFRCAGHLVAVDPDQDPVDNYYRSLYRHDEPLPITIEEHTGQLRSERAAEIQERFLRGEVNILSCTTTFELGVDVGDLRSVFMRNVPPSPANYIQRAGRTGRRTGAPGYALTFARLRSHDLAYYQRPEAMISGRIPAPACYLDNEKIAERHVYAVAISAFFRALPENEIFCRDVSDFFAPDQETAPAVDALRKYLDGHPEDVEAALRRIVPPQVSEDLAVSEWRWVDGLIGPEGRVTAARNSIAQDWSDLAEEREYRLQTGGYVDWISRAQKRIQGEKVIARLAAHGALPKYGFPTDLAELSLPRDVPESAWLEMQRGLRIAISEYAPGSEVVALKKTWRSVALKRVAGKDWETRAYWVCRECGHFRTQVVIGDETVAATCPICGADMGYNSTYVVPEFGFIARLEKKGVGQRRPRSTGGTRIFFDAAGFAAGGGTRVEEFPGGHADLDYARNGRLYAINTGPMGNGYKICPSCGGAGPTAGPKVVHLRSGCTGVMRGRQQLGTAFETDVLQIALKFRDPGALRDVNWDHVTSALWSCVLSASEMLVVPERELGGTSYRLPGGHIALLLYDDVPGGAGRVRSLSDRIPELFESALQRVSGECGCGEETSCYGCIRTFGNQHLQDRLTRAGALQVLNALMT